MDKYLPALRQTPSVVPSNGQPASYLEPSRHRELDSLIEIGKRVMAGDRMLGEQAMVELAQTHGYALNTLFRAKAALEQIGRHAIADGHDEAFVNAAVTRAIDMYDRDTQGAIRIIIDKILEPLSPSIYPKENTDGALKQFIKKCW